MIFRLILFFVVFAVAFYSFYWMLFRTKYFSAQRTFEIVKVAGLMFITALSAGVAVALFTLADQL